MKKVLLLFALLMSTIIGKAETWTPVGQVQWTEGALTGWNSNYNRTWDVSVERSDSRPKVFRLQPYSSHPLGFINSNVYVYLHTEDSDIYIEYYHFKYWTTSYSDSYHVFQRCPENGFDSRYYGKITGSNTISYRSFRSRYQSNDKRFKRAFG